MLRRVVVDKCHLIFTASHWRQKLAKLKNLRLLLCLIVLLTATLPPSRECELEAGMLHCLAEHAILCVVVLSWQARGDSARGRLTAAVVVACDRREGRGVLPQQGTWLGSGGLIVATLALGTGVDYPGVVYILHVGMPWSMIDFAQESGRGGRAREEAMGLFLTGRSLLDVTSVEREMRYMLGARQLGAGQYRWYEQLLLGMAGQLGLSNSADTAES
ncbi:uncharacterized protein BDR25DRAFT_362955 [Lindgomyces ingoldianus]|uniref:Uncharacterized protein n=1 Tax=Lindgomyces ingoldianus TaxID=673940 RepID=A0ACB6QAT1_9PLEO|nr:uncharacterized protein BDR25DRAFT_362955 [Lindgomyces ingoldianus]KAF2463237.1 hypothetical protein BDR25DRAFT_362955 [Lindgomyces ingoldianus]